MTVRRFDGIDDEIRLAVGACNVTGAVTVAVLLRPLGLSIDGCMLALHDSDGVGVGYETYVDGGNHAYIGNGSDYAYSHGGETVAVGEWSLVVVAKESGSAVPRFHSYRFDDPGWVHQDSGDNAEVGNGGAVAGGQVRIGAWQGGWWLNADVAAVALWGSVLTDQQVEGLLSGGSLEGWLGLSPNGLWLFDQESTGSAVTDLTAGGAGEVSLAGTTVVDEDPPIPYEAPDPDPPVVATGAASNVGHASARLNGTVNPSGIATAYWFEYGETTSYGASVPVGEDGDAGAGSAAIPVSERLTGLDPETTYHFRLVAESPAGKVEGADGDFTTAAAPVPAEGVGGMLMMGVG